MAEVNPLDKVITANMDPDGGKKGSPKKKAVPVVKSPEPPKIVMEEFLRDQATSNQEKIDEIYKMKVAKKDTEGRAPEFTDVPLTAEEQAHLARPEHPPTVPKPEHIAQAELNQAINDFEAKQSQIAEMRAKKTGRFASLGKALGIKPRNLDDDPEVMGLEKESHDLYRNLLSKGIHLHKGDKAQFEIFLKQFDEFEIFRATHNEEMDKRAEIAKWPESVLAGFHKIGKRWGELKKWQQIAISMAGGSLVAGTALAVGAGAITGLVITSGWRWGFRGFVSAAAGIGRKTKLDKKMLEGMSQERWMEVASIMQILQQNENDIDAGIAMVLDRKKGNEIENLRNNYEEVSAKNTKKALRFAGTTFLISTAIGETLRLGGQYTGINMGSILKKIGGYVGFEGGSSIAPEISKGSSSEAYYTHGPDGKITGLTPQGDEHFKQFNIEPHDSLKPEMKAGGSLQEWAKSTHAAGAEVQTPEITKPKFEDIASVKIKAGGTMWGSIRSNIEANPRAYGLDQADPQFKAKMNGKIAEMLHDFADKKGLSYKQLDKVFSEDTFKIRHDDITGKFYLDDYQGRAFGGNVSHGGAGAAQEIAPSKASIPVEDVKPRTAGAAAEHQPSRGGQKMKFSPEIEEMDRLAQENTAKANQYYENVQKYKAEVGPQIEQMSEMAQTKQFVVTRGLLNRLVEGAGVGQRANFWDQPIDDWKKLLGTENYIPQDVQLADEANKANLNLNKLRRLLPILEKYKVYGSESIGECLFKAMKDSQKNVYMINKLVLTK